MNADAYEVFSPSIIEFSHLMDMGLTETPGTSLVGGTGRDVVTQAFPNGNVAYTICPSWYVPALKEAAPDFNYQLTAIPASDSGAIVDTRAGWPVGVSASSTQQDEVLRFLSYALLPENMELLAGSKGNVSPLKNNTTSDEFYREVLNTVQSGSTYSDSVNQYGFDIVDTFNHITQQLHSGVPLDDTLADFKSMLEHVNQSSGKVFIRKRDVPLLLSCLQISLRSLYLNLCLREHFIKNLRNGISIVQFPAKVLWK